MFQVIKPFEDGVFFFKVFKLTQAKILHTFPFSADPKVTSLKFKPQIWLGFKYNRSFSDPTPNHEIPSNTSNSS